MKKKIIIFGIGLICVLAISFVLALIFYKGKDTNDNNERPEYTDYSLFVDIKAEYEEEYLNSEFTVDDFQWSNIKGISYLSWYGTDITHSGYGGTITVYLIEPGEEKIKEAMEHIKTLEFVYKVERVGMIYLDDVFV